MALPWRHIHNCGDFFLFPTSAHYNSMGMQLCDKRKLLPLLGKCQHMHGRESSVFAKRFSARVEVANT